MDLDKVGGGREEGVQLSVFIYLHSGKVHADKTGGIECLIQDTHCAPKNKREKEDDTHSEERTSATHWSETEARDKKRRL